MMIAHSVKWVGIWLAVLAFALGMSACNSGSDSVSTTQNTGGSVALLLTDAPSEQFDHIYLTIQSVDLLGDAGRVNLFTGSKVVDLLDLRHHAELFTLTDAIPAGSYEKIRLTVADVELVRLNADGSVAETAHPKLPGNGKIDIKPRHGDIYVAGGKTLTIQVDVDADKSIYIHQTGNDKYQFRPVIFADVIGADAPAKLVRLGGEIGTVDAIAHSFTLCRPRVLAASQGSHDEEEHHRRCLQVNSDPATTYLDATGQPAHFADLQPQMAVVAIGRFHAGADDDHPQLNALAVELGAATAFLRLGGSVANVDPITRSFDLLVADGQGLGSGTTLKVSLPAGTRIFSSRGQALDMNAIISGREVKVEGVLKLSNNQSDGMIAAIVFVADSLVDARLSGSFNGPGLIMNTFTISTTSGDRCVRLENTAQVYLIRLTSTGFSGEMGRLTDLTVGQPIEVFGHEAVDGCFVARDVLAQVN